ncbi:MAG: HAMP domain-containing protein, partial [Bacteroidetes bacterium]|nr:HAMP domain-containing protein [Bacteroidota bacterium]
MKIRDRLTYTLSLTGFIAITILGILIYFFTSNFYQQQFFVMLEERVALSELMFLENEEAKKAIRDRFLQRLEEEEEYAISLKPSGIDSIKTLFSESLYEKILSDGKIRFKNDRRYGAGKKYELQRGDYVVIVTATDQIGESHLRFLKRVLITGGILLILALIVVYRVGIARALRPLENKIYRASRIRADNLETRMEIENPDDEVGRVAIAFNLMLDRIQQAFEAQKHFVRNASHEMRNPLTAITGEIEVLLARERSSDEYKGTLRVIQKEAD